MVLANAKGATPMNRIDVAKGRFLAALETLENAAGEVGESLDRAAREAEKLAQLKAERDRQLARATDPAGTLQDHQQARKAAGRCADLLTPGRRILAFDPRGRGQVAEVHGDLTTAERTAVIVPGSDIDLTSFDRPKDPYGTPTGMATSLRAQMTADAPGTRTAVIAWAGYTTPVGFGPDAATGRLARFGITVQRNCNS